MATEFIIVIEADNRRAHAAYLKGLAHLDLIWPQLMAHAAEMDAPRNEAIDGAAEDYKNREAQYRKEREKYDHELEAWKSKVIFRGDRPVWPQMPYHHEIFDLVGTRDRFRLKYESIRAELKHMADVAGAAVGPFRMTEHKVREMVEWEDGSRIERIKIDMQRYMPAE